MRLNLKTERNKFKYTQRFVAQYLGMTERNYRNIEAGKRGTKEENWLKLFNLFNKQIPLDQLIINSIAKKSEN